METKRVAILHYSAPPIVGGVEAVMLAQARELLNAGYPVTMIAGVGSEDVLPPGCELRMVPEIDSRHPMIVEVSQVLERGEIPEKFSELTEQLQSSLYPILNQFEVVIIHNVLTKHFNLPLTVALSRIIQAGCAWKTIAWCHDFTWTSPSSRSKVHPGFPWDVLRTYQPGVTYVTVSRERQQTLADLFGCSLDDVHLVYNGVDPANLLGLSQEGLSLIRRLELLDSDLIILMPVRVTQAKNIERAIHLLAALKESCEKPSLVISGPPDPHDPNSMAYFASLKELARQAGVEQETRFVFDYGPNPEQANILDERMVGDLFRVSDLVFMPSHREGFGMPVLEAGLAGLPVFASSIPAALEIGQSDVMLIPQQADPQLLADEMLAWLQGNPISRMKRKVRKSFTWQAIFRDHIEQLLR